MKVDIRKQDNTKLESIDLNKTVFGVQVNDGLVHQVVTAYCLMQGQEQGP